MCLIKIRKRPSNMPYRAASRLHFHYIFQAHSYIRAQALRLPQQALCNHIYKVKIIIFVHLLTPNFTLLYHTIIKCQECKKARHYVAYTENN